jgi:hypothetical protein
LVTHPWPIFTPEANYYSMVTGAGPASTQAAGDLLVAHHAAMTATVATSSALGAVTAQAYTGVSGTASAAALVTHNDAHLVFAEETLARAQILHMAAAAHPSTVSQMVPAAVAHANRLEEATDEAINPIVLGALTTRIAELNLEYFGFMWPNNAAAGVRYGAVLEGLGAALMTPSLPAISGGSIAAVAVAAATVAESAALSGMQAAVGTLGSGVSAVAAPAAALPAAAMSAVSSSGSSAATPASSAPVQPLAAVTHTAPPTPAQTAAPAQSSAGMFAPSPNAHLMTPPPVPPTTAPSTAQPMAPRPLLTPPMPAATGITTFTPPAQPFSPPPPPSAGRAAGLKPGMLNAAALRGPVSTMPLSTASSTLTATQPLAYVPPEPPRPTVPPAPPQPPLLNPGQTAHTHNPPPQPHRQPPPHTPPPQPFAPQDGPPGPSTGSGGHKGSGGPGTHTPGFGLGQPPQAPPAAVPLDTRPPVPPPPEPGEPSLRHPAPPSWTSPQVPKSVQAAQDQLVELEKLIQHHNDNPPDPGNWTAVGDYNAEAAYYNSWAAQLHGELDSQNAQYTPATTARTADVPSWTQPAPEQSAPQGPQTPQQIDKVPLRTDPRQIEAKYKHANDFGVSDPRGRAGFDNFGRAVQQVVDAPTTMHIQGTYRGQPAILNYNPESGLCVIQSPDGKFWSGFELSPQQAWNVMNKGTLGGGD